MHHKNLLLLLFIFLSTAALGQAVSEGSESIGRGNLQIEPSLFRSSMVDDKLKTSYTLLPTALFRYGITDALELRAQSQIENWFKADTSMHGLTDDTSISGVGDLLLGAKYQLDYNGATKSQISLMSTVLLPTGSEFFSNNSLGIINTLILHKDLSREVNLLMNFSHTYLGDGRGDINYTFMMTKVLNDSWSFYFEPFGDLENFEDLVASLDVGLSYAVSDKLGLDFTYGTGLNHKMNFLSLGVAWLVMTDTRQN